MGYTYKSLISDGELVQGSSSDITLFNTDMAEDLSVGWEARYTIREKFDTPVIIERVLPLNEEMDGVPANSAFVHQIIPNESQLLTSGKKYIVTIQIKNDTMPYSEEVAQFKLKILPQGVN